MVQLSSQFVRGRAGLAPTVLLSRFFSDFVKVILEIFHWPILRLKAAGLLDFHVSGLSVAELHGSRKTLAV